MEISNWHTQLYIDNFSVNIYSGLPNKFLLRLFPKNTILSKEKTRFDTLQLGHIEEKEEYLNLISLAGFEISKDELIQRLEILGYTLNKAELAFHESLDKILRNECKNSFPDEKINQNYPDQEAFRTKREKIEFLNGVQFADFLNAINEVITNKHRRVIHFENGMRKSIIPKSLDNPLIRHLVCNGFGVFPFNDSLLYLRCLLASIDKNCSVFYEFSEPVTTGMLEEYYDQQYNPHEINTKYGLKTLILTEGVTDAEFIKASLSKLYPHLTDLYYFLDFALKDGSAQSLCQIIKSLAASNIPNNIIALFDNDTTGIEYMNNLLQNGIEFPSNIRIRKLPDLKLGENYPVFLKEGIIAYENVNGKGCAIEMYLGKELLVVEGELLPLSRKNNQLYFNNKHKKMIHKKFRDKLNSNFIAEEWLEMNQLLNVIFDEFK
ncbi:MAG TPA: hypothetical protein ENJ39_02810 [Flammeovirgaceae bacterium]|nr:hypothetical protein [Flammeovirgaceae bacterium]